MIRNNTLVHLAVGGIVILTAGAAATVSSAQERLPEGAGSDVFRRVCSACHEPEIVLGSKRTRDDWQTLIGLMMDLGAQGTDEEMGQITDYLAAHFGVTPAPVVQQSSVAPASAAAAGEPVGESRPGAAAEYLTEGVDSARTGWLKDEKVFNTTNVQTMRLLWKVKVDSTPRQMHNLFAPLTIPGVSTVRGPRELAIFAGISDELFAIDAATGETLWQTKFDSIYPDVTQGMGSTLCPGGQTAAPVIAPTSTAGKYTIYALSWDGRLHSLDVATGKDVAPPEKFAAPNGKPYALNLFNGVIYASTAQGCGGNTNAFLSFDLATKKASIFSPGGGMWGRRGVTVDPEGRVFMGTGDAPFAPETHGLGTSVVAVKLDANKQLQLVDYFAAPNANFMYRRDLDLNVTPMAFDYRGGKFLVATSKECRLWLLDRDAMGGADHRTALQITPHLCNDALRYDAHGVWGAMAEWQDAQGRQWVFVPFYGPVSREFKAPIEHARPTRGGVGAYTLEQTNGKWQLVPQWLSRDMDLAEHALVANGVVFVYGSGEDARQVAPDRAFDETGDVQASGVRRIAQSRHATLFALDALTGRELWSSGDMITSWNHYSGLTIANGRAYLTTFDGTIYAFGVTR